MSKQRRVIAYQGNIPVLFFKEGETFISYSPAIDLSTCGETFEDAKQNFQEALHVFFDECVNRGTLDAALESYGWKKVGKDRPHWEPPLLIGQDSVSVSVPAAN